jgi:tetratricopeptide (TPR) repeat protein
VAAQEAGRALALEPSLMFAQAQQVLADLLAGHAERCDTRRLDPYVGQRAMCLYSLGRVRGAAQLADSLGAAFMAGTAGDSSFSPVVVARGLAQYYAWTGDAEASLAWLERAYALSPEGEDFRRLASGIYDKVRADPRFQAGLQQTRTQIYERVQQARRSFAH